MDVTQVAAESDSLPFLDVCQVFERVEGTSKRLEIIEILRVFFKGLMSAAKPGDVAMAVHLMLSRMGPEYEAVELGVGEASLVKAIAQSTGKQPAVIKQDFERLGDLGLVAMNARTVQTMLVKPKPLTIRSLFRSLQDIAALTGLSANVKRIERTQALYTSCQGVESKYLFRLLVGKLRIGLAEQSLLTALAQASADLRPSDRTTEDDESAEDVLKDVYNSMPNYSLLLPILMEHGVWQLRQYCGMCVGIPVKPMLAFPTKSISQVLDRFENVPFTCEYKYDGERAQIHLIDQEGSLKGSRIYSRNMENVTPKYPDICHLLPNIIKQGVKNAVLDCEVVAWDAREHRLLPFQVLSTRKRKDVDSASIEVQVCLFAFDLLYLNDRPLLKLPLDERRHLLHEHFCTVEGQFQFAAYQDGTTTDEIQTFLEEAIQASCEGLMIKVLRGEEATYEPSKRSRNWLKVKKDYVTSASGDRSMPDSLDLVVIGGYTGRGKRTSWYGGFLLAVYDPPTETFQAVCKLGTGFSEQDLAAFAANLPPTPKCPAYVQLGAVPPPDCFFKPTVVWEVKCADLSQSPVYPAAQDLMSSGKGISLRFPRFIRERQDKSAEQATTTELLADFYYGQQLLQSSRQPPGLEEDEYY